MVFKIRSLAGCGAYAFSHGTPGGRGRSKGRGRARARSRARGGADAGRSP